MKKSAELLAKEMDAKNLKKIQDAFDEKRIDLAAKDYLDLLYGDSMECFRHNFYFLGWTLGAPKTPLYSYDPSTDKPADKEMQISEVGPDGTYVVHHRFDGDPLRNQFFVFAGSNVRLFVSSIVSVIVASQKSVVRALDKITGKYYDDYLEDVLFAVASVLTKHKKAASVQAVSDKITENFRARFVSGPAGEVLKIVGNMFPLISADLVRALDAIEPPFMRLKDVYRMKLLFDAVPQINAFIDYAKGVLKDRILLVKNKFYDLENVRNYRAAKIIVGFDKDGRVVPLEIICNVRTFFNAERQSHLEYESIRAGKKASVKSDISELHHGGISDYNGIICHAVKYLLHRVGWNMMYERNMDSDSFFHGFPEITRLPYPKKIIGTILDKLDHGVQNEVFRLPYAPRPLSKQEEIEVFRYITKFILFAALPYSWKYEEIKNMGFSGKLFNFVMKELYRYYENNVL